MLSKDQVEKINKAVESLKVEDILNEALKMGIELVPENKAYHEIKNSQGIYEKLDMDRHFRLDQDELQDCGYTYTYSEKIKSNLNSYSSTLAV